MAILLITGHLLAEFVNLMALSLNKSIVHVLADFVAFELLLSIDEIYYASLPKLPIMAEIGKNIKY